MRSVEHARCDVPVSLAAVPSGIAGRALYEESHLEYHVRRRSRWLPNLPSYVVQVGDLSVDADGLTQTFTGFWFYTNSERWYVTSARPPMPLVDAGLRFEAPRPGEDLFYCGEPRVELTADGNWLRIVLCDEPAGTYATVAEGVIAGISDSSCLVDFWVRFTPNS